MKQQRIVTMISKSGSMDDTPVAFPLNVDPPTSFTGHYPTQSTTSVSKMDTRRVPAFLNHQCHSYLLVLLLLLFPIAATAASTVTQSGGGGGSSSSTETGTLSTTTFEVYSDYLLGAAFLITAAVAAKRIRFNRNSSGGSSSGSSAASTSTTSTPGAAESAVMTSFYSLILATALIRAIYFLIPVEWWQPSYTPVAVHAWNKENSGGTMTTSTNNSSVDDQNWIGYALAEVTVTTGSVTLFAIFILILVYWADILKKYYNPDSRRTLPMSTFLYLVLLLVTTECANLILFLCGYYTTEGMILFNAIVLTITSLICVAQITLFSRKFQNVLKTLGAINQVSTDSQVRRIVWITVTGNVFFLSRAALEGVFAVYVTVYWYQYGTVARMFSHAWWDTYTILKYTSELTILALMLHILQSRFSNSAGSGNSGNGSSQSRPGGSAGSGRPNTAGYSKVPEATVDV